MEKLSKKAKRIRIVFITSSVILIILLLFVLGSFIWLQTDSGYKTLTKWTADKSIDSWQVKAYYGLYKKYPYTPQFTSNDNPEKNDIEPIYNNTDLTTQIDYKIDKDIYYSGETISLNLDIKSDKDINNASLNIYGIKNKYNDYSIIENKDINLVKGDNKFNYSLTLPYCNSCSGVKEGEYSIFIKIIDGDTLIGSQEFKVNLKQ